MGTEHFHENCHKIFKNYPDSCFLFTITSNNYRKLIEHYIWCMNVFEKCNVQFDKIDELTTGNFKYGFTFAIIKEEYEEWCKNYVEYFEQLKQFDINAEQSLL